MATKNSKVLTTIAIIFLFVLYWGNQSGCVSRKVRNAIEYHRGLYNELHGNETEAFQHYMRAAQNGDADAQFEVGKCYDFGRGVIQDTKQARNYYYLAAQQGHAKAQEKLGGMFMGIGNPGEAMKWFRYAAQQGDAEAQYHLAAFYLNIHEGGAEFNPAEAVSWLRRSAEQGYPRSQFLLGVCYKLGNGVAKNKSEAVKWLRRAKENGVSMAQDELNQMGY